VDPVQRDPVHASDPAVKRARLEIRELPSKLTPLEVLSNLFALPGAMLLETAMTGRGHHRSIVVANPVAALTSSGHEAVVTRASGEVARGGEPFARLRDLLSTAVVPESPPELAFAGGLVGCISYDVRLLLERLPDRGQDEIRFPDLYFGVYQAALERDESEGCWRAVAVLVEGDERQNASARLQRDFLLKEAGRIPRPLPRFPEVERSVQSNFDRESYAAAVRRIQALIRRGDAYQVNLSQRFRTRFPVDPLAAYGRLRAANPAPFMALLTLGEHRVLSASPERFLRLEGRRLETRPIKGTERRGSREDEDRDLAARLLASEKDRAELAMIVDVLRNDLSKVAATGTVKVVEPLVLETHPTVHHLVATVTAELREGLTFVDALRAALPGGSVTGAPKIRAMEIIDELERVRRGLYTGIIGYLSFDGRADTAVAIRTAVLSRGELFFNAGGGVTIASDPEREYEETLAKADVFLRPFALRLRS
jgi:para-aminobenzoate synthetase component 1